MRTIETAVEIAAPAQRIWDILTDFSAYPDWNPFIRQAHGSAQQGERLALRIHPPGGSAMTFRPRVLVAEAGRELRWRGRLLVPGLFDGEHVFGIESGPDARARLVHREHFSGLLVPLLWAGLEHNLQQGFEAMNQALKQRAEAG